MTNSTKQRRNFLLGGAVGGFAVISGASAWSLVQTLSPDADAIAKAGATVDLSEILPGEHITVSSGYRPYVIRHLTDHEIASMEPVDLDSVSDRQARNLNFPKRALATVTNRSVNLAGQFVIHSKVCTVRGCLIQPDARDERHAWMCPCCGSRYDLLGRVTSYAPRNLPIPRFITEYGSVIRILPPQWGRDPAIA